MLSGISEFLMTSNCYSEFLMTSNSQFSFLRTRMFITIILALFYHYIQSVYGKEEMNVI